MRMLEHARQEASMFTPAYVIRRVGSEYVIVRVDTPIVMLRVGTGATGLGLIGHGLLRGGWIGALTSLVGGLLAYHGVTGRDPTRAIQSWLMQRGPRHGPHSATPSAAKSLPAGDKVQLPSDPVEEASMESFPASDPPASRRTDPPPTSPGGSSR
jgi:hypothetical protein